MGAGDFLRRVLGRGPRPSPHQALFDRVRPFTMVGDSRLESVLALTGQVIAKKLPGAFVECGTCRGGSAALLAYQAKNSGWDRDVFLFDSFQGHPRTTKDPAAPDRKLVEEWGGTLVASVEDVRKACRALDADSPEHVRIFAGWVEDTLPKAGLGQIAFAHLDVDWYEPTKFALEFLLPLMAGGGFVQVDDYSYYPEGCGRAVREFLEAAPGRVRLLRTVGVAAVLEFL